jgi:hypothetical protein
MKILLLLFFIILSVNAFSQTDSVYKTDEIFSISYLNYDKKVKNLENVKLTKIDSISLSFEEIIYAPSSKNNKYIPHTIVFDKINSFGYKTGISMGERTLIGAGAGFGSVFLLGAILGAGYDPGGGTPSTDNKVAVTFFLSVAAAVPGALIGIATGIGQKEYEILDISKYSRTKKFEILKRLIRNGVKENE